MRNPNVYIGSVEEVPWSTDPTPDDDQELEATPEEVVQILGFDPEELGDE